MCWALARMLRAAGFAMALTIAAAAQAQSPRTGDAFGTEVTLPAKTIVYLSGVAQWDSAFDTIVESFKTIHAYLEREGIKPSGDPLLIYTSADDTGFQFQAALPVAEGPKNPPKGDIAMGTAPQGKAYKFVHRGSYDGMDNTYEAITNFLDQKNVDAQDTFIEEYLTDPRSTPGDQLVINVYVPIK